MTVLAVTLAIAVLVAVFKQSCHLYSISSATWDPLGEPSNQLSNEPAPNHTKHQWMPTRRCIEIFATAIAMAAGEFN